MDNLKYHEKAEVAIDRPSYRDSRWEKAVKVYTINQESKYLLVQNVHSLGVAEELKGLFSAYGNIEEHRILDDYVSEPFTEVHWVKFASIDSARIAKRKTDNRSFYGKDLHVCYAPEYESVQDTREKLQLRREVIARKTRVQASISTSQSSSGILSSSADSVTTPTTSPSHVTSTPEQSPYPHSQQLSSSSAPLPLFPSAPSLLSPLLPPPLRPPPSDLTTHLASKSSNLPSSSSISGVSMSVSHTSRASSLVHASATVSSSSSASTMATAGLSRGQRLEAYWSGDTMSSADSLGRKQCIGGGGDSRGRGNRGRGVMAKENRHGSPQSATDSSKQRSRNLDTVRASEHLAAAVHHSSNSSTFTPTHQVPGHPLNIHHNPSHCLGSSDYGPDLPLPVYQQSPVSGSLSVDKSISLTREKLRKVFASEDDPSLSQFKHKSKKRRRI